MCQEPGSNDPGWVWQQQEGNGGNIPKWEHLPVPDFHTVRQFDRFLAIWNDGFPNPGSESITQNYLDLWEYAGSIATGPDDRYDNEMLEIEKKQSSVNEDKK